MFVFVLEMCVWTVTNISYIKAMQKTFIYLFIIHAHSLYNCFTVVLHVLLNMLHDIKTKLKL